MDEAFQEELYNYYEVVIYRIFKDRAETVDNKFYRTILPYSGKTCIVKQFNKEIKYMKTITKISI